jgi:hypothetical protein
VSGEVEERPAHAGEVRQCGDLEVKITCSCGAWIVVQAEAGANLIRKHTFNRLCPAVSLAFMRMGGRPSASQ